LVMTRWSTKDLTGMLLRHQKDLKSDQWEVVEFPALMEDGSPVWPEYWGKEELDKLNGGARLVGAPATYGGGVSYAF